MPNFLGLEWHPGGLVAWVAAGLLAGWLAGKVMPGGGYSAFFNAALGLAGALAAGFVCSLLLRSDPSVGGDAGFWGSLAVAFVGAAVLVAVGRHLGSRVKF